MFGTFNMGVGLILIVSQEDADSVLARLAADGLSAWIIGEVRERRTGGAAVELV
jgi:phosphoribosylformylglycinamidine cyclo-ligase